jgi:Fe(3+) dicitrate transport protein
MTDADGQIVATQETDSFGLSTFPVELGRYEVRITGSGFRNEVRQVAVTELRRYDIPVTLKDAGVAETMTVVGDLDQPVNEFNGRAQLPDIQGTAIYHGKRTDSIILDELDAGLAISNQREVFAKVPGMSIWENTSSGFQIGIANRGLDPNRSWEMNSRQNGYDITADIFGYPEAYYTPPLEAVERIDIVRGSASLQYGAQFGGLVNYRVKRAPTDRKFNLHTIQTGGTDGHFNSHNRIGGRVQNWTYNSWYHHRSGDGNRPNGWYDNDSGYGQVDYAVGEDLNLSFETSLSSTNVQMPGGLTDADFNADPTQSVRSGQYFKVTWAVPSFKALYQIDETSRLDFNVSYVYGHREVIFDETPLSQPEDPNTNRTFWEDYFRNLAVEARYLKEHDWPNPGSALAAGVRYYHGNGSRQHGPGQKGTDPDFTWDIQSEDELYRDLRFTTNNYAVFAEHIFRLTPRLTVTPGFRFDQINTDATGRPVPNDGLNRDRTVPLFGVGATFQATEHTQAYGNISECYRATLWNDYWRSDPSIIIDPDIVDMTGYQAELGWRGTLANLMSYDVGVFYVRYNNKLGTITETDGTQYYTNISDSQNYGIEIYAESDVLAVFRGGPGRRKLFMFGSYAPIKTEYVDGPLKGNRVEFATSAIARFGATYSEGPLSLSLQHSYTGDQFTDASNTIFQPSAKVGFLPSYNVMDLSGRYRFSKGFQLSASVSNLWDHYYATRRSGAYPGPGRIPADGRRFQMGIGYTY